MKVTIDLDELPTDEKAEILRGLVFDQKYVMSRHGSYRQTGCYSTFDVMPEFVKIEPTKYPNLYEPFKPYYDGIEIQVTAYESETIVAMWWWDGDGSLLIWVKGEPTAYVNGDCKCTYDWNEVDA